MRHIHTIDLFNQIDPLFLVGQTEIPVVNAMHRAVHRMHPNVFRRQLIGKHRQCRCLLQVCVSGPLPVKSRKNFRNLYNQVGIFHLFKQRNQHVFLPVDAIQIPAVFHMFSHAQIIQHGLAVHMLHALFIRAPHHGEVYVHVIIQAAYGIHQFF